MGRKRAKNFSLPIDCIETHRVAALYSRDCKLQIANVDFANLFLKAKHFWAPHWVLTQCVKTPWVKTHWVQIHKNIGSKLSGKIKSIRKSTLGQYIVASGQHIGSSNVHNNIR